MSDRRVALVSGCGKRDGIGAAIARGLSAAGHAVVVQDIATTGVKDVNEPTSAADPDWNGVESLVEELKAAGGAAAYVTGDISVEADVARMIGKAVETFGGIDIVVNNAGAPFSMGHGEIDKIDPEGWDRVMSINLRGTFLMCRAAAPYMRRKKWGRVINIASVAGRTGSKSNATYAASKAGVIALTQSIAMDLGPDGVTSNAILPGFILTTRSLSGMSKKLGKSEIDADTIAKATPNVPMARAGTPEDVAGAVVFLASDAASYISGQSIIVDGGNLRL
ncbi:MAG: SDR family oxidoreductase [Caulobacterales bacterium]|nr:SDR family oxidoreductase [Caulobacterales bacterium]